MTERVGSRRFHQIGWRVVKDAAAIRYRTATHAEGAALADAIARLDHLATATTEVDVRSASVTVRIRGDEETFSERDLALASDIAEAADGLGLTVDLTGLQEVQIAIDTSLIPDVLPFWRAVLGYTPDMDLLRDPDRRGPAVWFQQMDAPRPQRNRIHIDIYVPAEEAEGRIAAALAAGGHVVSDEHAPGWWTLADPEGNEVDVAPWPDLGLFEDPG
jgi:4a-hydroxytetrahydrobiopterin dehydratase